MANIIFEQPCARCRGTGEVQIGTLGNPDDYVCPRCEGAGLVEFCTSSSLLDKLDDIMDRCNDVLDKCNDIIEKVSE